MKKILSICLAAAAFVGCTNSDVEFDTPNEIGFVAVADNITRNVVAETAFPTDLNLHVYAWTEGSTAIDYIDNGEFENGGRAQVSGKNVWGGVTPYYWPNVKKLQFAGYSNSGNVASAINSVTATVSYAVTGDALSISNYIPGTGDNDLMYFPATAAYGKADKLVPATMYHTCSWITFLVKGATGTNGVYNVTGLKITDIDDKADVVCTGTSSIAWSNNTEKTAEYTVPMISSITLAENAVNAETNAAYALADGGNVVVIPQIPGNISVTYSYEAIAGKPIVETVSAPLKLDESNTIAWAAGKHYIYTLTITANEILVAPVANAWGDPVYKSVTVE